MTEASVDAGAPLLAALRVLNLSQSAGATRAPPGRGCVCLQVAGRANRHARGPYTPCLQRRCTRFPRRPPSPSVPLCARPPYPTGARSDFVLNLERLQYR